MKVYEFYFNPLKKEVESDLIFESFCYEPKNIYEKKMGSFYTVGLLKNVLPKNIHLLENLRKFIKEGYYKKMIFSQEKALNKTLKETNEFLEEITKKGDVSWLGNLSFAVLSLKELKLNFTKVGGIKIVLIRGGKVVDIDRKLRLHEIEPYPLKIFGKTVSGKLAWNDLVLVFTQEVFDFFQGENLLNEIAKTPQFLEEKIKIILREKKEELKEIRGVLLAISLIKEILPKKREIISPKFSREFSFKEIFLPYLQFLKEKIFFPKIEKNSLKAELIFGKKQILIIFLTFILFLGSIVVKIEEKKQLELYQDKVKEIIKKVELAKQFLAFENPEEKEKANFLLKESLEKITPLLKEAWKFPKYFSAQVYSLDKEILKGLSFLNNLEEIKNPEIYFEFQPKKFIPHKLISFKNELYFFSPYTKNIFKLNEEKVEQILETNIPINLASPGEDFVLFFSKPNQLMILSGGNFFNFLLEAPYLNFNFENFFYFKGNLYFFDKRTGQIIKYPLKKEGNKFSLGKPEFWSKKIIFGQSMGVNGFLWVLDKNSILKYQAGDLKEKIIPEIFPQPKLFSKIFLSPNLPYLFVLEPVQKRILIFNKEGKIIKQFQSPNFDNLLDFTVSEDGKTIYLLNGLKVYRLNLP